MRRLLLVLLAAGLTVARADAQGTPNTIELTPTAGYWFGDTISRGIINNVNFDIRVNDTPSYGLRIAYRFAPNLALEGFFTRERADLSTGNGGIFSGANKVGTMDMTTAEANFEFSFGHQRLVPFIVGGVGAMRLDPTITVGQTPGSSLSSDTRFVGDFGGGLKLFFTPQVALRFDWRGHSVNLDNGHDCDWWGHCSYNGNWLTFTELGLGLTFVL
ncbi:MAG: outer membrane beta-barrel protein [Thermoanaerobaculaceae bacterium]|jgi:opacity protein-like surface antigen